MFSSNGGGRSVAAFATLIAIILSDGLSTREISELSSLFSSIGSSLSLISTIESGNLPSEGSQTTVTAGNTKRQTDREGTGDTNRI